MIKDLLEKNNINLTTSQINKFEKFLILFLEKNSQLNLSAIRDEEGVIEKHFIDSIILDNFIHLQGNILDIGTGGGFPGIPLAITNQDCNFILLDSTRKKIDAVNGFCNDLALDNCRGIWGRAEELAKNTELKGQFDFIVSRATAYLPQIFEWSYPFLKKGGKMIFYKLYNEKEISDGEFIIKRYGKKLNNIHKYTINGQERALISIT